MATRLYFANTTPDISPTPHSQWWVNTPYNYATLVSSPTNTAFADKTKGRGSTGGTLQVPQAVIISGALLTGTQFSTSDTFMTVARAREGVSTHDASSCVSIRVLSSSGTEQAVLYTENIVASGNIDEWSTSYRNQKFPRSVANDTGTALQVNYTTVAGDRLEVTLGSRIGGSFGVGTIEIGDPTASTDLAHNNTGLTQNRPWIEFSNSITFLADVRTQLKSGGVFDSHTMKLKQSGVWDTHAYKKKNGGIFS